MLGNRQSSHRANRAEEPLLRRRRFDREDRVDELGDPGLRRAGHDRFREHDQRVEEMPVEHLRLVAGRARAAIGAAVGNPAAGALIGAGVGAAAGTIWDVSRGYYSYPPPPGYYYSPGW